MTSSTTNLVEDRAAFCDSRAFGTRRRWCQRADVMDNRLNRRGGYFRITDPVECFGRNARERMPVLEWTELGRDAYILVICFHDLFYEIRDLRFPAEPPNPRSHARARLVMHYVMGCSYPVRTA